jgi:hypothetical protein
MTTLARHRSHAGEAEGFLPVESVATSLAEPAWVEAFAARILASRRPRNLLMNRVTSQYYSWCVRMIP